MSAFSAAAADEDGDTISALRAENEQLRQSLLAMHNTLEMTARAGAHHAMAAECLRETVIRWASRAEQAEGLLESIGAGGVGKLEQPPVVEQAQVEQEPAPNGATHRQPKQGAFYKRVDGKWYVWSRMKNGESRRWYISPGTTESCLEPLYSHPQPAQQPLTDDQLFDVFEGKDSEIWWQFDFGRFQMVARAIERAHGIRGEA